MKQLTGCWWRFRRIQRFEYWPYMIFYFPMFFYGLYLALRSRSAMYFSTANPCMKYGGVMGESKMKILKAIDSRYIPTTVMIKHESTSQDVLEQMRAAGLSYPVVAKPDQGERGRCVEMIPAVERLMAYHSRMQEDYLLQEFIDLPVELGILYYRIPGENRGSISSVTRKGFLTIQGDGHSTVAKLVQQKMRARHRMAYFRHKFALRWDEVLPEGETLLLEPIGNHNRGTVFYDGRSLISPQLVDVIESVAGGIRNFYYGRFDIKAASLPRLCEDGDFKILELNGVSSEPAHIYDPCNTLLRAYSDVLWHMRLIATIARKNHDNGHDRDSLKEFIADLWHHFRLNRRRKKYPAT